MARSHKGGKNRSPAAGIIFTVFFIACVAVVMYINDGSPTSESGVSGTSSSANGSQQPFGGDGYILKFGADFRSGMNAVDDLGLSIVLAVDQSGSMQDPPETGGSAPKYVQAARAIEQIVGFLEKNFSGSAANGLVLKLAIIGFSNEVNDIFPLTEMNAKGFAAIRKAIADPAVFEPQGKTAIGAALEQGSKILAQSGTILKSLIVVTDGENNLDPDPVAVIKAINENRIDVSTVDLPLFTSGTLVSFVGFDIDSGTFGDIHTEGAHITSAADQAELESALQQILIADITRLEASGK